MVKQIFRFQLFSLVGKIEEHFIPMKNILILLVVMSMLFFCHKGKDKITEKKIDFKSISIAKKDIKFFTEIGKITRVVKLESKDNSLIGNVNLVTHDEKGDFYVGDYYSGKKVLRFDNNGNFITNYGRPGQGPGEYVNILCFTPDTEGNIVLVTSSKLIKFNKDGKFLKEKRINYFVRDIAIIDNLIYLYVLRYLVAKKDRKAIFILDPDFEKVGEISQYDTRLQKYLFLPKKIFGKSNNQLYFIDIYDLRLNIFNPDLQELSYLQIPNENAKLDSIWRKKRLSRKDEKIIGNRMHRFGLIFGFKDWIFLYERYREKNLYYDAWLLNPVKRKAIIFPYLMMCRYSDKKFPPNLYFNYIAGSYENGIIGVFDSVERFNKYKKDFPILKGIEFKTEDNPILALFEFDRVE